MKEQTAAAFLDMSGAYDNVILDILCEIMVERNNPFVVEPTEEEKICVVCLSRTGYKGLPQGSVPSPFLYSLLGSGLDRFIPVACRLLQYADDVVENALQRMIEIARALVQTACSALKVFLI
jgi:hypothetical protein